MLTSVGRHDGCAGRDAWKGTLLPPAASAPRPPVGGPFDRLDVEAPLGCVAAWRTGDDQTIAGLQRLRRDAALLQPARRCPLGGVLLRLAVLVEDHQVNPRVRAAVLELGEIAFDPDRLLLEVFRGE